LSDDIIDEDKTCADGQGFTILMIPTENILFVNCITPCQVAVESSGI